MAITTVANLNTYLGESDTTTAKTNAVNAACSAIETYCGRVFDSATYTEWHYLEDSSLIALNQFPVTTLTSVQTADDESSTDLETFDATCYRKRLTAGQLQLYARYTGWFKVIYIAGYSTIPADVVQIANEMAAAILSGASTDSSLQSEKIGDYQYANRSAGELVTQYYDRLKVHRNVRV